MQWKMYERLGIGVINPRGLYTIGVDVGMGKEEFKGLAINGYLQSLVLKEKEFMFSSGAFEFIRKQAVDSITANMLLKSSKYVTMRLHKPSTTEGAFFKSKTCWYGFIYIWWHVIKNHSFWELHEKLFKV